MSGLKELLEKHAVVALLVLLASFGSAQAVEDTFSAELDSDGLLVEGHGSGFDYGSWYYYPYTDWYNQWFFNGFDPDRKKVISVDLTFRILDPTAGVGSHVTVALNWTTPDWPIDQDAPPLPWNLKGLSDETRYIQREIIVPKTDIRETLFINTSHEIGEFCPLWVSIDIRGVNVSVEGRIRHECEPKDEIPPPLGERDFGDAPEAALAYPSTGVIGLFPTCVGVGPASWIEHDSRWMWFGPLADLEFDGNGGFCPAFNPDTYDRDERVRDGDAGLIKPRAFTIRGPVGSEKVWALTSFVLNELGTSCEITEWGRDIDIEVHNQDPDGRDAYVNLLVDWNQDGKWQGSVRCGDVNVPEHTLVNFRVPYGYNGELSKLNPPNFRIGPFLELSYLWCRFTITERPVPTKGWNGDGVFRDGETEDYLLRVREKLDICDWGEDDPHKMHWAQIPDLMSTGMDVDLFSSPLGDDFRCSQDGPITDIHFWGSFLDDVLPDRGPNALRFRLNIYSNRPADFFVPWSRPGELLWSKELPAYGYDVSEVTNNIHKGWFEPSTKFFEPENHRRTFQYNICLDPQDDLFVQKAGTVYWLVIEELREDKDIHTFGWSTTQRHLQFNDNAVWFHPQLGWRAIDYPTGHPSVGRDLDLAFVITGEAPEPELDFGDAPDPTYATVFASNGARHTIVRDIHLGIQIDGELDGQPNAEATGDDNDGTDDEDGVTFLTDLEPGEKATVEVSASIKGVLNAWIDWNADGDWDDADEHVVVDDTLNSGTNPLVISVPATAAPGETFARFRFSTVSGLDYDGFAPDGEVEDHRIRIAEVPIDGKPPLPHLKWSQPPVEMDPTLNPPVFCGWDEPAFAQKRIWYGTGDWTLVADDFRCVGDMPVTSVHWWGSYEEWLGQDPPSLVPDSWRIAFWSNVPADDRYRFSRPERLLWLINVPADRVEEERVGSDRFPGVRAETTFQYLLRLEPHEYFQQGQFATSDTQDRVFWISITPVYSGSAAPSQVWGWKTRPNPWMDAAVSTKFSRDDLRAGMTLDPAEIDPITNSFVCERLDLYDMAFELDTEPDYIKWEQAFTGLRNWPHYEDEKSMASGGPGDAAKWDQAPDTSTTGVDVDITKDLPPTWPTVICADDFECTQSGPITKITLWTSWYHDVLPKGNAENVTFTLSIRQDIPAKQSSSGHSKPGKVLWRRQFDAGDFTVEAIQGRVESFYNPANANFERDNHLMVYKYTFEIESADAFDQTGTPGDPTVYWLAAQALVVHAPGTVATRLGWKTSLDHWNDEAVWVEAEEPYSGSAWQELRYPKDHPFASQSIDLAFEIETQSSSTGLNLRRVVADDWRCSTDLPVTGLVWWGSYIGYGYRPCECQQAPAPRQPDHFLLSIWTDVPDPDPSNPNTFSKPGQKVWEYRAKTFDEVLVGFDKHPEPFESHMRGFEPVYRYTVRLPESDWFCQQDRSDVYWLSIVAVFEDADSLVYPWGWTNHPQAGWGAQALDALLYWKLDETSGVVAADSSGNGNNGLLRGDPVWMPFSGVFGGALDLDGRGDYVKVDRPVGLNFAPNSFSVSVWARPREVLGQWRTIAEYNRESFLKNRFGLWIDPEGRFHFRVGWSTWHTAQQLLPDRWYHLVATYNRSDRRLRLYVDGVLDGMAVQSFGFSSPALSTLTVGVRGDEAGEYFNGLIDDFRVFDSALTQEDILTLAGFGRNDNAVAADLATPSTSAVWPWRPLLDQTGEDVDMSFMLFTDPLGCLLDQDADPKGLIAVDTVKEEPEKKAAEK